MRTTIGINNFVPGWGSGLDDGRVGAEAEVAVGLDDVWAEVVVAEGDEAEKDEELRVFDDEAEDEDEEDEAEEEEEDTLDLSVEMVVRLSLLMSDMRRAPETLFGESSSSSELDGIAAAFFTPGF